MADEILGHDLFGDPVLARREGRGRPEAVWNRRGSDLALLAFARGLTVKDAAEVVGLSQPTFRRVYFSECRKRKQARLKVEMLQLARLNDQAAEGNVSAERELGRRLDVLRMRDVHEREAPPPRQASKTLGKKEAAQIAAQEQTGLYDPPSPPMIN